MYKLNLRTHQRLTASIGILLILLESIYLWSGSPDIEGVVIAYSAIVIGIIMTTYRHILLVDAEHHRVIRKVGCLYLLTRNKVKTDQLKKITLREKVIRRNNTEVTWYQIIARESDIICQLKNSLHARKIAESLARSLSLSLDNRLYYVRSLRKPDELDQPVAERWRATGITHDPPIPPADTQIEVNHAHFCTHISLPAEHGNRMFAVLFAAIIAVIAGVMLSLVNEEGRLAVYVILTPFACMLVLAILSFSGRTSILLTDTHVITRQGLSPIKRKVRLKDVEEFIRARDGIYLDGDEGSAWVHWAGSKEDSDYLEALLAHEIARRPV